MGLDGSAGGWGRSPADNRENLKRCKVISYENLKKIIILGDFSKNKKPRVKISRFWTKNINYLEFL